ncbi:MAG: hypothetical protein JWQ75_683, partial [Pseudarthrobacter sp.]|nr:hypothetical protein [Pseudarthrobacter sp.]
MATATVLLFTLINCTPEADRGNQETPVPQPSAQPAFVAVLERYADDLRAQGASAVIIQIRARTGAWSTADGVRSHEGKEPVQLTDQVQVGGITQAMVAVAVMQLV